MATSTRVSSFSPAATQFFEDLKDQNSREFWLAHKDLFDARCASRWPACWTPLPRSYQPFKVFR
jgi:uncharacterized protein (DUF2461 family)